MSIHDGYLHAAKQRLLNYRNFAALRHQGEGEAMQDVREGILENLNNNLNSAGAFAVLDRAISGRMPNEDFIKFLDDTFGLDLIKTTPGISNEQKAKIEERKRAKEMKDYALADKLRDELSREGIAVLDGKDTIWQYK